MTEFFFFFLVKCSFKEACMINPVSGLPGPEWTF